MGLQETALWGDVSRMPRDLAKTLDEAAGFEEVARLITAPGVRRVVATGNGASYYVAQALWLTTLNSAHLPVDVIAVPGGLVAKGRFRWRDGDVLLAVSASGEFRDLIEAVEHANLPRGFAVVTSSPDSTLARAAEARALVSVPEQLAITHTQAFCGAVAACLSIWALAAPDRTLSEALSILPDACALAIERTAAWAQETVAAAELPRAMITFGTGPGWAAALENALLVKEVARLPCEGAETREGATATMTGLLPDHLALSLPLLDDPFVDEAEEICAKAGAPVLRAPGGDLADARLAAVTTFPAAAALSIDFALRAGWQPDNPDWMQHYLLTARQP